MNAAAIRRRLQELKDDKSAETAQRYFKTGKGEYAEGDIFLGIRAPILRGLAKEHRGIPFSEAAKLLKSKFHEERTLALLILINIYSKADDSLKKEIFEFYFNNIKFINNWDLVDCSAEYIVGDFLKDKSRKPLYESAKSVNLWERRISIISTFHYIKRGDFSETLKIAKILLKDEEDLIHKAVGWMLREIGKRSMEAEEEFLKKHYKKMPRTMLRYAIERFPEPLRQSYLKGSI